MTTNHITDRCIFPYATGKVGSGGWDAPEPRSGCAASHPGSVRFASWALSQLKITQLVTSLVDLHTGKIHIDTFAEGEEE